MSARLRGLSISGIAVRPASLLQLFEHLFRLRMIGMLLE